jgi:hypothetical protein
MEYAVTGDDGATTTVDAVSIGYIGKDVADFNLFDMTPIDLPAKSPVMRRFFILPGVGPLPELKVTVGFPFPIIERVE